MVCCIIVVVVLSGARHACHYFMCYIMYLDVFIIALAFTLISMYLLIT